MSASLCDREREASRPVLNDSQQIERQSAIMRILRDGQVRRQEDLVRLLKKEGHEVTQSSVSRDLRDLGVSVFHVYVGEFATSMEMAGASISVLKLDAELKRLLAAPASSPFFMQEQL